MLHMDCKSELTDFVNQLYPKLQTSLSKTVKSKISNENAKKQIIITVQDKITHKKQVESYNLPELYFYKYAILIKVCVMLIWKETLNQKRQLEIVIQLHKGNSIYTQ